MAVNRPFAEDFDPGVGDRAGDDRIVRGDVVRAGDPVELDGLRVRVDLHASLAAIQQQPAPTSRASSNKEAASGKKTIQMKGN